MSAAKPRRPVPPDFAAGPDQDLEGLGGPAVDGPAETDVEGLGPGGDIDQLDSTHRTTRATRRKSDEMGLDPRADDDGLDTDGAYDTEAYDSGLGQDPGLEAPEAAEGADGSDTRSR
jgi:hypothetical protein